MNINKEINFYLNRDMGKQYVDKHSPRTLNSDTGCACNNSDAFDQFFGAKAEIKTSPLTLKYQAVRAHF